jgi:hypothetical protein
LLGDRDIGIEIVYGEKKKYLVQGRIEQPRQNKNLLYWQDKPKEGPVSFVLFESPFTSVSTVSRGHPSLFSLIRHYIDRVWQVNMLVDYVLLVSICLNTVLTTMDRRSTQHISHDCLAKTHQINHVWLLSIY